VFSYEVKPTNFFSLPEDKQKAVLGRFLSLLNSVQGRIRIMIVREPLDVLVGNEVRTLQVIRTYMTSDEPLEYLLDALGFEYSRTLDVPSFKIKSERLRHVVLDNGLAKCYTLYSLPSSLPTAWIHSLFAVCDTVILEVRPVEHDRAVSKMNRYSGLVKAASLKFPSMMHRAQMSELVLQSLVRQETKMFLSSLVAVVKAKDIQSLKVSSKDFERNARSTMARFEATASKQASMLQGWGKKLHMELGTLGIYYPFVSADMLEVPNGVVLGINANTGAPVIYDYSLRDNFNVLILATSGAGKSVTSKLMLKRLMEKYPDSLVFVIDPQGEYEKIADYLKLDAIRVTEETNLGFDPFKLFSAHDAADVLGDITYATNIVKREFRAMSSKAHDIFSLYELVGEEAKKYLLDLVSEPTASILKGEARMSNRIVISLKGTYGEESIAMLLLFALAKVWKQINAMPANIPKILLIDEGWMLFNMASAGKFLNMLARVGRKLNVIFMFVTQRPEDVITNEYGRAILDNSETKILLRNNELASMKIAEALQLSKQEEEMLRVFGRGEALMLTRNYRLRVQITPSSDELKMFSTSPEPYS